jgi:hypothetical protein
MGSEDSRGRLNRKVKTVKSDNIVEHARRELETDVMFCEVALGFGIVLFELVFIQNVRPTRRLVKPGMLNAHGHVRKTLLNPKTNFGVARPAE